MDPIREQDHTSFRGPLGDPSAGGPKGSGSHLVVHLMTMLSLRDLPLQNYVETILNCGPRGMI